jgi:Icc-related predicted phosphoesterase
MKIALVGDVHGDFTLLDELLRRARDEHGVEWAVQVGDFGFFADRLPARPPFRLAVPLHAVCGNHEDHDYLARALRDGLLERWAEANLYYQARASVVQAGPLAIGFIGGALHTARPQQRHGGNVITHDQVERAVAQFAAAQPEVIVSHSCPSGIGIGMQSSPGMAWGVAEHVLMAGYDPGPAHDCGESQLADLWRRLTHRPRLWCFGHFHQSRTAVIGGTQFWCLPRIQRDRPLLIWDDGRAASPS